MVIGMCLPLFVLPQVYEVWYKHQTAGISLITWSFFVLQAGVFAIFAIKHKEKPLIVTYVPLFFIQVSIVTGLLYFR